jgi:hypothetical protein
MIALRRRRYVAKNALARGTAEFARLKKFHAYSLGEYGLSKEGLRSTLGWYYDAYKL